MRPSEIRKPHFSEEITELLRRNQLVAEYDTLVKNGVIDTVWTIMTRNKRIVIEREVFSK